MPSFLGYIEKEGKLPEHLTFSLAALMAFYTGTEIRDKALIGHRGSGNTIFWMMLQYWNFCGKQQQRAKRIRTCSPFE